VTASASTAMSASHGLSALIYLSLSLLRGSF
jgi:hypothetical protein